MAHLHWTGAAVYPDATTRDEQADALEAFAAGHSYVDEWANPDVDGQVAGVERLDPLDLDETVSGPGLRWSYLLPESVSSAEQEQYDEAMTFGSGVIGAPPAVDGTQGSGWVDV